MSIKVDKVTKIYGQQRALDEVSMNVKRGEIVGLLGPNGAGKSTLMKIITCFLPPTAGSVAVDGFDTREDSLEVRKKIGYLPENNPLYYEMYVKEYLYFIAGVHKLGRETRERVRSIIETTGLGLEQNKKLGALSKGYKQRVGLAQAMIHDPDVLILDEPTSGLDPNQLLEIRNLIRTLGQQKTVILSTHIMQEVEAVCDRVVIIHQGKIVADDSTVNLQKNLLNRSVITVEFNKAADVIELKTIEGVVSVKESGRNTYDFESAPDQDIREQIFSFAVKKDLVILSQSKSQQRIEDVFHKLTGG